MAALPKTADGAGPQRYLIALGSNLPHHRHGPPRAVLAAALEALRATGIVVEARSPVITTTPLGPSRRNYANAAACIACDFPPLALLDLLQATEAAFGRNRRCQRWSARVLDLDIVLWQGGPWRARRLTIPHRAYRQRAFVLIPAAQIAPDWRDPLTGRTIRHQLAHLTRRARGPRGA